MVFLARRDLDWREVRLEDVGEFVARKYHQCSGVLAGSARMRAL